MNGVSSVTANIGFSTSRAETAAINSNREVKTTQQKDTFIKPNTNPNAKTYFANKAKIEASPMDENIKIALDVIA